MSHRLAPEVQEAYGFLARQHFLLALLGCVLQYLEDVVAAHFALPHIGDVGNTQWKR